MTDVVFALSLLTPFDIDIPKVRIGPACDGGYVLANDFSSDQSVVSYGIHLEYRFDELMASRGHQVYMFDHTIDGIRQAHPNMHFFKEGVAGRSDPSALLYTIDDHLSRHGIPGDRMILKMDVEGHEFEALIGASGATLDRFEQITFEIHGLHRLCDPKYRFDFVKLLQKMNRSFTLFHVHANNYDGSNNFHFVDGLPVSELLELSYIKTSHVKRSPSRTLYPTYLDHGNIHALDKRLWFFPFLPTDLRFEDSLLRSNARNCSQTGEIEPVRGCGRGMRRKTSKVTS